MQLFRGYVPTKDKQCLERFKGKKHLNTLAEVSDLDEYAGILGDETILIDVDDGPTSGFGPEMQSVCYNTGQALLFP